MPSLKLDDQLCFAIYSAGHAFARAYKPLLEGLGLTYPQYLVLLVLWAEEGVTVGAIGEKLFLESSTLTPLLKRLEAQGLLVRVRGKNDERQVIVHLTAAGRKLADAARDVPKCMQKATGATAADLARIRLEVGTIRDNLLSTGAEPA